MINHETVLILGAGASIPFGFPSGRELKNQAIELSRRDIKHEDFSSLLKAGLTEKNIREFGEALNSSGVQSVDRFLEYRQEFIETGKAIIALILIKCENESLLFNTSPNQHWYEYLYSKLAISLDEFASNKLRIITFNYDRSLEFFLTKALANTHGIELEEAHTTLLNIPIIHVHGQLGKLVFGDSMELARQYKSVVNSTTMLSCLREDGIKIIHEADPATREFTSARTLLIQAERIICLGFGYDRTNLYRLGMLNLTSDESNHRIRNVMIIGSSYGLTHNECNNHSKMLNGKIVLDRPNLKSLEFLREKTPFD